MKQSDSLVQFVNISFVHCYKSIVLKLSKLGLKNKNIYHKTQKEFIEYYLKHEYQSISFIQVLFLLGKYFLVKWSLRGKLCLCLILNNIHNLPFIIENEFMASDSCRKQAGGKQCFSTCEVYLKGNLCLLYL